MVGLVEHVGIAEFVPLDLLEIEAPNDGHGGRAVVVAIAVRLFSRIVDGVDVLLMARFTGDVEWRAEAKTDSKTARERDPGRTVLHGAVGVEV